MIGSGFSFGLGTTLGKVATRVISSLSYIKDNLKVFFDFKNTNLEHVGTGSANISTISDGSGDWIEYTDATLLDAMEGIDTLTIMAWVRRDDSSGFAFITKGGYYASNTDWGSEFQSNNGRMRFSIEQDFTAWEPPPDTYLNTWVHYAITYDKNVEGSNIHRVVNTYYNGDQDYGYGSGTPATVGTNGNNIRIGASSTGVGPLRGNIKNVGIWNRVLSKEEVRNVMYKSYSDLKGSELTNLQLWADLDTDFNGKDGNGRTITGSAAGNANIMQGLYGNNLPVMPRGVDNSKAALANQIGSGSASFDGTDDYINCGDADNLSFGNESSDSAFSWSAWIKFPSGITDSNFIISKDNSSNVEYQLFLNTSFRINARCHDGALEKQRGLIGTTILSANAWHHIAWTYNGTGGDNAQSGMNIYLNGALEAVYSEIDASSYTAMHSTSAPLYIGLTDRISDKTFKGNIAQVGLFNAVLTQEQIQSIKEKSYSELTISEKENLVSWWGLDSVLLGNNFGTTPSDDSLWDRGSIVEDSQGSLTVIINETFEDTSNWEETTHTSLSINADGNMVVTASGGNGGARYKPSVTLENSTEYLIEWSIAGGTDTSMYFRNDDTDFSGSMYGNGYLNGTTASNANPKTISYKFKSHSSETGFYAYMGNVNDTKTGILKSFKLYKINSGNYGVLK